MLHNPGKKIACQFTMAFLTSFKFSEEKVSQSIVIYDSSNMHVLPHKLVKETTGCLSEASS